MSVPEHQPWSRQQWVGWIAASFAAHIGLIVLLGARPAPPPVEPARFHAALAEELEPRPEILPDYEDPAWFALPNAQGFSGAAWMRPEAPPHQFHEWAEAQRWLALDPEVLGAEFIREVRANASRTLAITEKHPPKPNTPEWAGAPDWLRHESRLRVEGALAGRRLIRAVAPPAWPLSEVLSNTVVQVQVDQRGWVLNAVVIEESGMAAADQEALRLARQLLFEKSQPSGLTGGRLVFEWLAVPATNAPAP